MPTRSTRRPLRRTSSVAALVVTIAVLASCSGGDDDGDSGSPSTNGAVTTTTTEPASGATTPTTTSSGQADLPTLKAVRGAEPAIVDEQDRQVLLRGINVNSLGEYAQADPDLDPTLPVTDADWDLMADQGFNVVRLLVSWSRLEPERGKVDADYIEQIRRTVREAADRGLYTVIDMHQDAWGPFVATPEGVTCPAGTEPAIGWDGAPEWATPKAGVNSCRGSSREDSDLVRTAWDRFYGDTDGIQSRLVAVWRRVARDLGAEAGVAGYDLLNEPNDGSEPNDTPAHIGRFFARAIGAIRSGEKAGRSSAKPIFFEYSVNGVGPPVGFSDDPGLVFAPHIYGGSIAPLSVEANWSYANGLAATYKTTIWVGEYGWFDDPAGNLSKVRTFGKEQDLAAAGGTWWQWRQACGDPHSINEPGGKPADEIIEYQNNSCPDDRNLGVVPEWAEVSSRPYPKAAPGRIDDLTSDGKARTMRLQASGGRSGTKVVVWVPGTNAPVMRGSGIGAVDVQRSGAGWEATAVICSASYVVTVGDTGGPGASTPPEQCTAA